MIPINEAHKRLIAEGYDVCLQSPYRELTILNASYPSVKQYLLEQGYEGNIIVVGKPHKKRLKENEPISKDFGSDVKTIDRTTKINYSGQDTVINSYTEDSEGQLSFF